MKKLPVPDLLKLVDRKLALRELHDSHCKHLSGLLSDGVDLPPITIFHVSEGDKTIDYIGDGMHTLYAASRNGLKEYPVMVKSFPTLALAQAEGLRVNEQRGLPPTEGERKNRLMQLVELKMNQTQIAKAVGLTQASISRILAGKQKEGEAGGKTGEGARGSKESKPFVPLTAKSFITTMGKINKTFARERAKAAIEDFIMPGEDGKVDIRLINMLRSTVDQLDEFVGEIEKAVK